MTHRVFTRIPPCDPKLITEIAEQSVADLHEAMDTIPGRMALLDPAIRALTPGLRVAGQAVTVHTFPGDALIVHEAIRHAAPGSVLVITSAGRSLSPMFAELMSLAARERGVAGVIADGLIRDADALIECRFPVWCRGTYAGRPLKRGPGEINVPVVAGGVQIEPGDIIVADTDGALRIPLAEAADVLDGAQKRATNEISIRAAIASGETLFDILGLQQALDSADIKEFHCLWNEPPPGGN